MNTISWKLSLIPAAALAALPVLSGCEAIECGDGTIEVDGVCEVDIGFDDTRCAEGTELIGGECVPIFPPTECDPDTTSAEENDETGVTTCVGTGGGGCATIRCETPEGGKVSLCGQIYDVETGLPIRQVDPPPMAATCEGVNDDPNHPCSLQVEFYDALAFVANPSGTAPLDADLIEINDCGHFKGINLTRPFNGFVAVGLDDTEAAGATHDHKRQTGIALPVEMGETSNDLRAFVINRTTDEMWTETAGNPFDGPTFVDEGVYVPVFRNPGPEIGPPVEGVVITAGGTTKPDDDYYFSDTDPELKTRVDATLNSTGLNGTGLLTNSSLGQHSATGGEPAGCEWESELATAIPTVVFFRETFLHAEGNPGAPCE